MQKITPHLWFDSQAEEAATFYTSLFKNSSLGRASRYGKEGFEIHGQPEGKVMTIGFTVEGFEIMALNGGPLFKFTPAVSFLVACATKEEVDALWTALAEGGKPLMEIGSYPFSERYGWIQDRFGLSWQVMFMGNRPITQKITPTMMFTREMAGKAEEAINFYVSLFKDSKVGDIMRYGAGGADKEGTIGYASFMLAGRQFAAMDSAGPHQFGFTEAISFMVRCENQEEIDFLWGKLSAVPESEQCGWLKDKYGFSWQIVPTAMDRMMAEGTKEQLGRVTNAFLKMKKFDVAALEAAYKG